MRNDFARKNGATRNKKIPVIFPVLREFDPGLFLSGGSNIKQACRACEGFAVRFRKFSAGGKKFPAGVARFAASLAH